MRALLDTHTLLWATIRPERLSRAAVDFISNDGNEVVISAASAWEIATKVRLGRLPGAQKLEAGFLRYMEAAGYLLRAIEVEDALRAGRFRGDRQDPFDRMIAAQALEEDIPVISSDKKLDEFGVRRIW